MISVGDVLVSDEIRDEHFVCDLTKCKGACCVEGDMGAPLDESELAILNEIYDDVKPFLNEAGKKEIEKQGLYVKDEDGDFSTPIIEGRECAYSVYEADGTLACGIEKAYLAGKVKFQKPISCHLYPIRVTAKKNLTAINYDVWHICSDACTLGKNLRVPLYQFLKNPLIRKFGESWYNELLNRIQETSARKKS